MSRADFDRVAPIYERLEKAVYGRALDRVRLCLLEPDDAPGAALLLGEGDGRFLREALVRLPRYRFVVVEKSAGMLAELRSRLRASGLGSDLERRVELRLGSVLEPIPLEGGCDLVATHFFLDCFAEAELEHWVPRIARWLTPEGRWLVSEFQARRSAHRVLVSLMYRFFRVATGLPGRRLPRHAPILRSAGLERVGTLESANGLLVAEQWTRARRGTDQGTTTRPQSSKLTFSSFLNVCPPRVIS